MVPCERHSSARRQWTRAAAADHAREATTHGEVFQVDHDGEGHPQGFVGRHHAPPQGDDALRRERSVASVRNWCRWRRRGGREGSWGVVRGRSPWGGCWRGCCSQSSSSRSRHSRAGSCLWWWRIWSVEVGGTRGGSSESTVQNSAEIAVCSISAADFSSIYTMLLCVSLQKGQLNIKWPKITPCKFYLIWKLENMNI